MLARQSQHVDDLGTGQATMKMTESRSTTELSIAWQLLTRVPISLCRLEQSSSIVIQET